MVITEGIPQLPSVLDIMLLIVAPESNIHDIMLDCPILVIMASSSMTQPCILHTYISGK